jgi:hypothetical protein
MAWRVSGKTTELCSCKLLCPCWLGPEGEPDQGWCAGAFGFDIEKGESDGVDLSGTRVALSAEWPGNFFHGNGTARLYLDERASDAQRRELEAIFGGKKGGMFEAVFGGVISNWLPARTAKIEIGWSESPTLRVDDVSQVQLSPLHDEAGKETQLTGAVGLGALQVESMHLADARGSRWSDPDMRAWQGDSGSLQRFDWRG